MRVGDVARAAGVSVRSVHHYEEVGLLRPGRAANGYREFTEDDVRLVSVIRRLQRVGFSLTEIRDVAPCWQDDRPPGERPIEEMRELYHRKIGELDRQIAQLQLVRDQLADRLNETTAAIPTAPKK